MVQRKRGRKQQGVVGLFNQVTRDGLHPPPPGASVQLCVLFPISTNFLKMVEIFKFETKTDFLTLGTFSCILLLLLLLVINKEIILLSLKS